MSKTIEFFIAGFSAAMENLTTQLTSLLDTRTMTLLEQITELKAGQQVNADKIQQLITTSSEERDQVGGLITIASSQQETIAQLNARIQELIGMIDIKDADNQAAIEAVNELLTTTTEQSEQIEAAIAGVQEIYNPA
jgi:chromosome segregation ATPase